MALQRMEISQRMRAACHRDRQATGRAQVRRILRRWSWDGHGGRHGRGGGRGENVPGGLAWQAGCWRDLPLP